MVIEQLDKDKSGTILLPEIENALNAKFFDKKEDSDKTNAQLIVEELKNNNETELEKTFMAALAIARDDLLQKDITTLTSDEIKMLQLAFTMGGKNAKLFKINGKMDDDLEEKIREKIGEQERAKIEEKRIQEEMEKEETENRDGTDQWVNSSMENMIANMEYEQFIEEFMNQNPDLGNNAFENIKSNLGDIEYRKFLSSNLDISFAETNLSSSTVDNIIINPDGKLAILSGDKRAVLSQYIVPKENQSLFLTNIKSFLEQFCTSFPDPTDRHNEGTFAEFQASLLYEQKVVKIYTQMFTKENIEKFRDGSLNLAAFGDPSDAYLSKAFCYFLSDIGKGGITIDETMKKWSPNCALITFFENNKDTPKNLQEAPYRNMSYAKLYYSYIQNTLGDLLVVTDKNRTLGGCKVNFADTNINGNNDRLSYAKDETDIDAKLTQRMNVFKSSFTDVQYNTLLKTKIGKDLLKNFIIKQEQAYVAAIEVGYEQRNKLPDVGIAYFQELFDAAQQFNETGKVNAGIKFGVFPTEMPKGGSSKGGEYNTTSLNINGHTKKDWSKFYNDYPGASKYIEFSETSGLIMNPSKLEDDLVPYIKEKHLAWIEYMKQLHAIGATKNINMTLAGQDVNMRDVIENGKTIISPFVGAEVMLDFSQKTTEDIADYKQTLGAWLASQRHDITTRPVYTIGNLHNELLAMSVGVAASAIVTAFSKSPTLGAVAFTVASKGVKTEWDAYLEGVQYLRGRGGYYGDTYENFGEALATGALRGFGALETTSNAYGEEILMKDETGAKILKDPQILFAEHVLEVGTNIAIFRLIGPLGGRVVPVIEKALIKEGGAETMTKVLQNFGVKTFAHFTGLLSEITLFTGFGVVTAPVNAGVMTFVATGSMDAANQAAINSLKDAFDPTNLAVSFFSNAAFMIALKGSGIITSPLCNAINLRGEAHYFPENYAKANEIHQQFTSFTEKNNITPVTREALTENIKIQTDPVTKASLEALQKRVAEYDTKNNVTNPDQTELLLLDKNGEIIPKDSQLGKGFIELNGKLSEANKAVAIGLQTLQQVSREFRSKDPVKNYEQFIKENRLSNPSLSPDAILNKRIQFCQEKIKKSAGEEKVKYENILKDLLAKQNQLKELGEKYQETLKTFQEEMSALDIEAMEIEKKTDTRPAGYENMPADYQSSAVDLTAQLGGEIQIYQEYTHPEGWDYAKLEKTDMTGEEAKKVFEEYKKLNPSLQAIETDNYAMVLTGIAYKFNVDDIAFATGEYIKNWRQNNDQYKEYVQNLHEFTKKYKLDIGGLMLSPKTMARIEEFLQARNATDLTTPSRSAANEKMGIENGIKGGRVPITGEEKRLVEEAQKETSEVKGEVIAQADLTTVDEIQNFLDNTLMDVYGEFEGVKIDKKTGEKKAGPNGKIARYSLNEIAKNALEGSLGSNIRALVTIEKMENNIIRFTVENDCNNTFQKKENGKFATKITQDIVKSKCDEGNDMWHQVKKAILEEGMTPDEAYTLYAREKHTGALSEGEESRNVKMVSTVDPATGEVKEVELATGGVGYLDVTKKIIKKILDSDIPIETVGDIWSMKFAPLDGNTSHLKITMDIPLVSKKEVQKNAQDQKSVEEEKNLGYKEEEILSEEQQAVLIKAAMESIKVLNESRVLDSQRISSIEDVFFQALVDIKSTKDTWVQVDDRIRRLDSLITRTDTDQHLDILFKNLGIDKQKFIDDLIAFEQGIETQKDFNDAFDATLGKYIDKILGSEIYQVWEKAKTAESFADTPEDVQAMSDKLSQILNSSKKGKKMFEGMKRLVKVFGVCGMSDKYAFTFGVKRGASLENAGIRDDADVAMDFHGESLPKIMEIFNRLCEEAGKDNFKLQFVDTQSHEKLPFPSTEKAMTDMAHMVENGTVKIEGRIFGIKVDVVPEKNGNGVNNIGYDVAHDGKGFDVVEVNGSKFNIITGKKSTMAYAMNFANEAPMKDVLSYATKPGQEDAKELKDSQRLSSIILFGGGKSLAEIKKIFADDILAYSKIPQGQRCDYVNNGIKNLEECLKLLDKLEPFEVAAKANPSVSTEKPKKEIKVFTEFYDTLKNQKQALFVSLDAYSKTSSGSKEAEAYKKAIVDGIAVLDTYRYNVDYSKNDNAFAYTYENYSTSLFTQEVQACINMKPEELKSYLNEKRVARGQTIAVSK